MGIFYEDQKVLEKFKAFYALVECGTERKLKCIQIDNGGECIGPFDGYYKEHGICHEQIAPKTPQQDGVAERMEQTLIEKVRCMLSRAKLLKYFRGEAMYI